MTYDVDDVGALATLHALADRGEVKLLGVLYSEVHSFGAVARDAINTWYGRNVPVGSSSVSRKWIRMAFEFQSNLYSIEATAPTGCFGGRTPNDSITR